MVCNRAARLIVCFANFVILKCIRAIEFHSNRVRTNLLRQYSIQARKLIQIGTHARDKSDRLSLEANKQCNWLAPDKAN